MVTQTALVEMLGEPKTATLSFVVENELLERIGRLRRYLPFGHRAGYLRWVIVEDLKKRGVLEMEAQNEGLAPDNLGFPGETGDTNRPTGRVAAGAAPDHYMPDESDGEEPDEDKKILIQVYVPENLRKRIDEVWPKTPYGSRTAYLRAAIIANLVKQEAELGINN